MPETDNQVTKSLEILETIALAKQAANGPGAEERAKARTLTRAAELN